VTWLGLDGVTLASRLGLPRVEALSSVPSTMDAAHALAAGGAPAGTLVLAEEQSAGRGRSGRAWSSSPGAGLWLTLIERPRAADGLDVLSLRVGLHLAPVLERWTESGIRLKWPNDLYVGRRKLAGVLIEARWRGDRPDWIAIGLGINLVVPRAVADATSLVNAGAESVLAEVVPALRASAFARGPLTTDELSAFAGRDLAVGQRVSLPSDGFVRGISAHGELLVETAAGLIPHRAGSLVFAPT
jgi:BirA family biotin operon repressor/biotin-[acetyl-CoA-carboxylase] ligase